MLPTPNSAIYLDNQRRLRNLTKFSAKIAEHERTGVLRTTKTNRSAGLKSATFNDLFLEAQQNEGLTKEGLTKEEFLSIVNSDMNNTNWRDRPQKTEAIRNQVTVSSWDVDQSGTITLPSSISYRYIQVRESAIRTSIYNFAGSYCDMVINGVKISIPEGSYTAPQLLNAVREALVVNFGGNNFTVTTNPITFTTTITKTSGDPIPFNFNPDNSPLLRALGFISARSEADLSMVTSDKPLEISTLNVYAFAVDNMGGSNTNWAKNCGQYHAVIMSSHASGSIARGHNANIVDTGAYRDTQHLTIRVLDLQAREGAYLLDPRDHLWSLVIDLW